MQGWKGFVCIVGTLTLLSACASTRPASPAARTALPVLTAPESNDGTETERIVVYAERIRWFAPSTLEAERSAAERDLRRDASAFNRLRMAVLLSLRRAPFRDDARARELLSSVAKEPGAKNQPLRSYAMSLLQDIDDRWASERMLEEERRQRLALQKKLDQLKAVEEDMDRRTPAPAVPPPR